MVRAGTEMGEHQVKWSGRQAAGEEAESNKQEPGGERTDTGQEKGHEKNVHIE